MNTSTETIYWKSPAGLLSITTSDEQLTKIAFEDESATAKETNEKKSPLQNKIIDQLTRYFEKTLETFNVPIKLNVTPFQLRVLKALQKIPAGQSRSYGDIAAELNTSARAVGNACRINPIPIIIPCHRVVAKNSLGGYFGETDGVNVDRKVFLLSHERAK